MTGIALSSLQRHLLYRNNLEDEDHRLNELFKKWKIVATRKIKRFSEKGGGA